MDDSSLSRVLIIGAGFAGLNLARKLDSKYYDVTLIDRNNYHSFIPLLYQVATGGLEAGNIAYPLRRIFRKSPHVNYRMASVDEVDLKRRVLHTNLGEMDYDYLVIATGSKVNFYNFADRKEYLLTLKSVNDALQMRATIMERLEEAAVEEDPEARRALLTFAIIGGGPTGIELAGVLTEMRAKVLPKDFPGLNLAEMQILLFEQAESLLLSMSDHASRRSLEYMQGMGVDVQLETSVVDYDGQWLSLDSEEQIATRSVIWAAGVQGAAIGGIPEHLLVAGNRLRTNTYCQLEGYEHVFSIGDAAATPSAENPKGLPMLAPVAIQQGQYLAKALNRRARGSAVKPFSYFNKGVMATIGRAKAVADLPFYSFSGFFAWLAWLFVHLFYLVGFRSKLATILNWASNYFRYDRPLGLIIRPDHPEQNVKEKEEEEAVL